MGSVVVVLTVLGVLGTGINAGIFYAFSGFVMPALKRIPPSQGMTAMQSINVTALRPPLMIAMFGTAALCVALVVSAVRGWSEPFAAPLLAGAVLFLAGVIVLTIVFHVPLNNALDKADPSAGRSVEVWTDYLRRWGAGNQARWVTPLASSALFTWALIR
ncbi:DUF1772 domain-containing protein [Pseudonocardia acaciae]|uniref:anthrone oxygenase family protein n=1 Tax=Pseudonocardia acaciae TaxID=551276 RepID=UPI00048EB72B|nr:anthrone oxygenase family protein [Pseudonocardia acaciae]